MACGRGCPELPQPAPAPARRLEAGERWARLAQARAASRPGLCAIAPGRRAGAPPLWQLARHFSHWVVRERVLGLWPPCAWSCSLWAKDRWHHAGASLGFQNRMALAQTGARERDWQSALDFLDPPSSVRICQSSNCPPGRLMWLLQDVEMGALGPA